MYAVIKSGGKQYKIVEGQSVEVEKLVGNKGDKVIFSEVLAVRDEEKNEFFAGSPVLKDYQIDGTIEITGKRKKVTIYKIKRRKYYRRKIGHRQLFTRVKIGEIRIPVSLWI